jgi:hypothetical protein
MGLVIENASGTYLSGYNQDPSGTYLGQVDVGNAVVNVAVSVGVIGLGVLFGRWMSKQSGLGGLGSAKQFRVGDQVVVRLSGRVVMRGKVTKIYPGSKDDSMYSEPQYVVSGNAPGIGRTSGTYFAREMSKQSGLGGLDAPGDRRPLTPSQAAVRRAIRRTDDEVYVARSVGAPAGRLRKGCRYVKARVKRHGGGRKIVLKVACKRTSPAAKLSAKMKR